MNLLTITKVGRRDNNIPIPLQAPPQFYGSCTIEGDDIFLFYGKYIIKLLADGTYKMKALDKEILCMQYNKLHRTVCIGLREQGVLEINVSTLDTANSFPGLHNKSVTEIAFDDEGGEWFTTLENGVYYNKNKSASKLIDGQVFRVYNYNDSALLFANNKGLFRLYNSKVIPLITESNKVVHDIQVDKDGNMILAGNNDGIKFSPYFHYQCKKISLTGKQSVYVFHSTTELSLIEDESYWFRQGHAIMKLAKLQSRGRGYRFKEIVYGLPDQGIIYRDNKQQQWLGGLNNLYLYNNNSNQFHPFKDSSNFFSKGVTCMRQMFNGVYIIGIRFGGMVLMQDSTILGNITEDDGLLSNSIKYILPVGNRLWLATPNGISVIQFSSFQPLKYTIKNLGEVAGLSNMIIYQLISFKGNILAATSKGIYQLNNIEQLLAQDPLNISLYITTLNYYKGDTSGIQNIALPYMENRLTVNFEAIGYNTPKEMQCYYRLFSAADTVWRSISSRQIVLENLAPGNYQLQIKAAMPKQGRYSGVQTLNISIEKPWWQWNLIRIGALLFLLTAVYVMYQWRIGIIKKRESEKTALKKQMTELEQTALRSQMNPHFIFNCLSSIQQLVVAGDKEEANEYLVKFSRLIRKTLELSASSYINLAQEKDYLSEYLVLEQLRMPGGFEFDIAIDSNIDIFKTEIPNMMLQPIVENCIRHGIKHLQNKKGRISISILKKNNCIRCEVTDNGIGRNKTTAAIVLAPHKSYGMGIVEKRLTGLPNYNPDNYFVKIEDLTDNNKLPMGTKVILQVPFKINAI